MGLKRLCDSYKRLNIKPLNSHDMVEVHDQYVDAVMEVRTGPIRTIGDISEGALCNMPHIDLCLSCMQVVIKHWEAGGIKPDILYQFRRIF